MKIITGMHRSGTSAVARLFFESGADLGDPGTFYKPDRWNPEGYFEQPEIHAVNMPLINGPWGRLAYLRLPDPQTIARRAQKLSDRIARAAEKYQNRLVKETRFCLTLDAWRSHGARIEKILICLREPMHTAESLKKRNRIPLWLGLCLWQEHLERLLSQTADLPVWFVAYHRLLDENAAFEEISGAFRFFGEPDMQDIRRIAKTALKPQMDHHAPGSYAYPAKVRRLWQVLTEKHKLQFSASRHDALRN